MIGRVTLPLPSGSSVNVTNTSSNVTANTLPWPTTAKMHWMMLDSFGNPIVRHGKNGTTNSAPSAWSMVIAVSPPLPTQVAPRQKWRPPAKLARAILRLLVQVPSCLFGYSVNDVNTGCTFVANVRSWQKNGSKNLIILDLCGNQEAHQHHHHQHSHSHHQL